MSSQQASNSHVGPKATGGKAGAVPTPANAHLGTEKLETKPRAFDSDGAIGKQFTETGAIGQIGEKVGGPLSSEGVIGKQFTDKGAIGGTIQNTLGGEKQTGSGLSGILPKSN
ncbi:hypothetical protein QBC32DRAFT_336070 [Pseudoneurospora amorphoporcata]|uniref:Uncharacterized protein n=1 Tax=Pseudoneurospora amorphoporcata TaxID=241081 RepID=A0AAN6P0L8_9PEZI|nr:hypothetical protein QBC32DRAFT_336070 [Pseudoneurospora amorphoporcata]